MKINTPPYFTEPLDEIKVKVSDDVYFYTLPSIKDDEGD